MAKGHDVHSPADSGYGPVRVSHEFRGSVVRQHHGEIQIAIGAVVAAGDGAEEVDALGVEVLHQPPCDFGDCGVARHVLIMRQSYWKVIVDSPLNLR